MPDPDQPDAAVRATDDPTARSLWLADGRRLGYAEYGDPRGTPLFFFHGEPGSRLTGALLADHASAAGVRLIAPDRPGYGLSTFQPHRGFHDWPPDVLALADRLGIDRFRVVGWSGGGPYALACAAAAPDRVRGAGVLAGVDRLQHLHPRVLTNLWGLRTRPPERWSDALTRVWMRTRTPADHGAESRASAGLIAAGIREAVRESSTGALQGLRLLGRDWDFDPGRIRGVPVRFWHGLDDVLIPARHTRAVAARIPGAQATYVPGCGHVTILTLHGREILAELRQLAT